MFVDAPVSARLSEAIEGGPLDAPIADAKLHKMEAGNFAPEFPLEWALKDVDLRSMPGATTRCHCWEHCRRSGGRRWMPDTAARTSPQLYWRWAIAASGLASRGSDQGPPSDNSPTAP
jgi:hypothetical protein